MGCVKCDHIKRLIALTNHNIKRLSLYYYFSLALIYCEPRLGPTRSLHVCRNFLEIYKFNFQIFFKFEILKTFVVIYTHFLYINFSQYMVFMFFSSSNKKLSAQK
jgi:hypothetical protein